MNKFEIEFENLLSDLRLTTVKKWTFSNRGSVFQNVYIRKQEAAFRTQNPRKLKINWKKIDVRLSPYKEVYEKFRLISDKIHKHFSKKEEEIKNKLREIAKNLNIPQTKEYIEAKRVSVVNYSTQGFGCTKYARGDCESFCQKAKFYGLRTKIKEENGGKTIDKWGIDYGLEFCVSINTDELGLRILEYKEEIPLKEWMKLCWKTGTNPRVYDPFLPEGLEDKIGIDYFGKNKDAK